MRNDPTAHQVRVQPIMQRHGGQRHAWPQARLDDLLLECRAVGPATGWLDFLILFHGVHVSIKTLVDTMLADFGAPIQDAFTGRLP